jgi:hypothetical protein
MTDDEKLEEIEKRLDGVFPPDYYVIDWPVTIRKWQFGIYVNEVLESNGIINHNAKTTNS